jgi:hypothetical protein
VPDTLVVDGPKMVIIQSGVHINVALTGLALFLMRKNIYVTICKKYCGVSKRVKI